MSQNPFYVHPGTDFGPGLMGLAQTVGEVGERKKAEQKEQAEIDRVESVKAGALKAMQSHDPDTIKEYMATNPEVAESIKAAIELKLPGESADKYKAALFRAATDPSQATGALAAMKEELAADGLDAAETEKINNLGNMIKNDPDKAQKVIASELALLTTDDEELWKRYKDITTQKDKDKPLSPAGKVQYDIDEGFLTEEQAKEADKTYAPTQLTKLFTKLDSFPKGSKRGEYYQKAIDKLTTGGNPDVDLILAQRIVDGKVDFNKLSRRGGQKGRIAAIIGNIAPDFSLVDAEANIKYKTDSANLRTIALIAGIQPLYENLSGKAKELSNSTIPIFNKGVNAYRLQTGDAKVVAFNNLRDDVIAETERVLMGSGVLSDSKYLRALHNLNTSQSPEQMGAAIQQMMLVIQKRDEALRREPYPQASVNEMTDDDLQKIVRGE